MEFISFIGGNTKSTYQRTKALEFLISLQDLKPLIQKFSNNDFRRSVIFPYLKLIKQNSRWTIIMAIRGRVLLLSVSILLSEFFSYL